MRLLVVAVRPGGARLVRARLDAAAPGRFEVLAADSLAETVTLLLGIDRLPLDAVLLDLPALDATGLQTLEQVRTAALDAAVVVQCPEADDAAALACIRAGAQEVVVEAETSGRALARTLRHAAERKRRENALARQALHDPLTGLPNRALFLDRLRQALSRLGRTHSCLAVLFLDLDAFKQVNDDHGHAAGDALLQAVAGRIAAGLRGGDTAARFGGDEFVVLCEDIAGRDEALAIATRLLAETGVPASMGLAVAHDAATDPDALLRDADASMYAVKRAGGRGVRLSA